MESRCCYVKGHAEASERVAMFHEWERRNGEVFAVIETTDGRVERFSLRSGSLRFRHPLRAEELRF